MGNNLKCVNFIIITTLHSWYNKSAKFFERPVPLSGKPAAHVYCCRFCR